MKITKVNYKNQWLDLTGSNGKAQNFIVITGESGVGKTDMLRVIRNYHEFDGLYEYEGDEGLDSKLSFIHFEDYQLSDLEGLNVDKVNAMVADFGLNVRLDSVHASTSSIQNNSIPIFATKNGNKIYVNALSNSERRIYTQAIVFCKYQPKNTVILIDEPETSLHPSLQLKVANMYRMMQKEGDNQIIMTTNSPQIVSCFEPENVFRLQNDENGEFECVSMYKKCVHTRGCEPNDIIVDVFETPLRDDETKKRIRCVADLLRLNPDKIDEPENKRLIESLISDLGENDAIVMHIEHELSIIESEKNNIK
ncbi:ATP-binding protein [Candidatus Woesearchaeota archaeon]|nr:ATP-binding protein [Candidatus Woesearchaeota archaeon]